MAERRPSLPKLGESLRFYVENTLRARVRNPGIERYRPQSSRLPILTLVFLAAVVLVIWIGLLL